MLALAKEHCLLHPSWLLQSKHRRMNMDFSQLHTYTPPQCAPENTGYTYSLRWDLGAVEEFSISATLTSDSTQPRELTQNKAKLSLRTISVFLLLILFFGVWFWALLFLIQISMLAWHLSCFKTKPLGVLSQQFIRKHYRVRQICNASKLWNKHSFQVILFYQCLVLVSQLPLKKNPVVLMTHPHDSVAVRSVCILNWGGSYRGKTSLYAPLFSFLICFHIFCVIVPSCPFWLRISEI